MVRGGGRIRGSYEEDERKVKVCQLYHYLCNFSLEEGMDGYLHRRRSSVWLTGWHDLPGISVLIMPTKHSQSC